MLRPILFVLCSLIFVTCSRNGGSADVSFDLRGPAQEPDGTYAYDVTIVFSNDLHDQVLPTAPKGRGGLARHATLLRWLREEAAARGKGILVCNAGDCFEGTLFYEHDGGATVFRLLESMDYDAVQIGNHDHQFGFQRLYDVIQSAFPLAPPTLTFLGGNLNPMGMNSGPFGSYQGPLPFEPAPVASEVIAAFENGFDDFLSGTVNPHFLIRSRPRRISFSRCASSRLVAFASAFLGWIRLRFSTRRFLARASFSQIRRCVQKDVASMILSSHPLHLR
jgi:hypothetical protein